MTKAPRVQPEPKKKGRRPKDWTANSVLKMSLVEAFDVNMARASVRTETILARRIGMNGNAPETLEDIGRTIDLDRDEPVTRTREAMRQIVRRFAREVFAGREGVDALLSECDTACKNGPVALSDIDSRILKGIHARPDVLTHAFRLAEALSVDLRASLPHVRDIGGKVFLVCMPEEQWNAAVDDASRVLHLSLPSASNERANALMPDLADGTREALLREATASRRELRHGDLNTCVKLFVEDSPHPVSLDDIVAHVLAVTGKKLGKHRVVNIASAVAVRVSRGRYTSHQRLVIPDERVAHIRQIVLSLMDKEPHDRQWHASEFMPHLPDDITPDMLAHMLKDDDDIRSLGRMVFTLGDSDGRARLRDLVVKVINEAGRPMSRREIREAVSRTRGLGAGFNISNGDDLRRVNGLYETPDVSRLRGLAQPSLQSTNSTVEVT